MASTLRKELYGILSEDNITVGKLISKIDDKSYALLFLILSLPSAMPIPAPGYSTFFSVLMIILSLGMFFKKPPFIPKRFKDKVIKKKTMEKLIKFLDIYLKILEKITKPRLKLFLNDKIIAILIMIMSLFMIIPYPLTNTVPSISIFILAFSLINDDGLITFLGLFVGVIGALIALLSLTLGYVAVKELIKQMVTFLI
ncbi:MAG: exopolysaccharide biosynthesis protein [Candidatus Woesearchaeota archaeon]